MMLRKSMATYSNVLELWKLGETQSFTTTRKTKSPFWNASKFMLIALNDQNDTSGNNTILTISRSARLCKSSSVLTTTTTTTTTTLSYVHHTSYRKGCKGGLGSFGVQWCVNLSTRRKHVVSDAKHCFLIPRWPVPDRITPRPGAWTGILNSTRRGNGDGKCAFRVQYSVSWSHRCSRCVALPLI